MNSSLQIHIPQQLWKTDFLLGNFGKHPQSGEKEESRDWMAPQGEHFENFI
jgi:hypothetical protein